jgi:hypothetical protein
MLANPVRWIKDRMGHPLEAFIELEIRDANGKLLTFRKFRAKSWLPQLLAMLKGHFMVPYQTTTNGGNAPITDTGGVVRYFPYLALLSGVPATVTISLYAGEGVGDYGLVVGTSDAQNAVNQYAMGAVIPHGNASGQLYYGATSIENPQNPPNTNYWIFRIIRTFTNNSGASITVREIGLVVKTWDSGGNTPRYFLIARDVISPVTVPNGATLTIRYIPKITVS